MVTYFLVKCVFIVIQNPAYNWNRPFGFQHPFNQPDPYHGYPNPPAHQYQPSNYYSFFNDVSPQPHTPPPWSTPPPQPHDRRSPLLATPAKTTTDGCSTVNSSDCNTVEPSNSSNESQPDTIVQSNNESPSDSGRQSLDNDSEKSSEIERSRKSSKTDKSLERCKQSKSGRSTPVTPGHDEFVRPSVKSASATPLESKRRTNSESSCAGSGGKKRVGRRSVGDSVAEDKAGISGVMAETMTINIKQELMEPPVDILINVPDLTDDIEPESQRSVVRWRSTKTSTEPTKKSKKKLVSFNPKIQIYN